MYAYKCSNYNGKEEIMAEMKVAQHTRQNAYMYICAMTLFMWRLFFLYISKTIRLVSDAVNREIYEQR